MNCLSYEEAAYRVGLDTHWYNNHIHDGADNVEAYVPPAERLVGVETNPGPMDERVQNAKRTIRDRNMTAGPRKLKTNSSRRDNYLQAAIVEEEIKLQGAMDAKNEVLQDKDKKMEIPCLAEKCLINITSGEHLIYQLNFGFYLYTAISVLLCLFILTVNIKLFVLAMTITIITSYSYAKTAQKDLRLRHWFIHSSLGKTDLKSLRNLESCTGKVQQCSTTVTADLLYYNEGAYSRKSVKLNQDIVLSLFAHFRYMSFEPIDMLKYSTMLERTLLVDKLDNIDREYTCYYAADLIKHVAQQQHSMGF